FGGNEKVTPGAYEVKAVVNITYYLQKQKTNEMPEGVKDYIGNQQKEMNTPGGPGLMKQGSTPL
ncbi:MAG: hypothetical protein AAFS10_07945, partial [Myxococcota bacterium]